MQINDPLMAIAELQEHASSLEQALETCQTDIRGLQTEVQRLITQASISDTQSLPRREQVTYWRKLFTGGLLQIEQTSQYNPDLLAACPHVEHGHP